MDYYIDKFWEMIVPAFVAALTAAACLVIVCVVFKRKMKISRGLLYAAMIAYLTVLLITAVFERGWNPAAEARINLIPLNDLLGDVVRPSRAILMLGLNTAVFVPWGFLLPALYRPFRKFGWNILAGFSLSIAIEVSQLVGRIGIFETDDLIFNTIGAILGFLMYKMCGIILHRKTIYNEEGNKK